MALVERIYTKNIDGSLNKSVEKLLEGSEIVVPLIDVSARRFTLILSQIPAGETFLQDDTSENMQYPVLRGETEDTSGTRSTCLIIPRGAYTQRDWQFVIPQTEHPNEVHAIEYVP